MWPIDFPKAKFKIGDKVRHTLFNAVGTITAVRSAPWLLPRAPFAYVATWEPKDGAMPRTGQAVDLDAAQHPEELLKNTE